MQTMRLMTTTILAMLVAMTTPADAGECRFKFQCSTFKSTSRPVPIYKDRDFFPERVAEIYDPGNNKPLQIRDPDYGRVLFRIEKGTGAIIGPTDLRVRGRIGD